MTAVSALGKTPYAQIIAADTSVPAMALAPGAPPPLLQHRVHQGLGTGTGLCMPRACLLTPLCQPWRWHEVHPPLSPNATQSASRVGDQNMNTHAQSMPVNMCVASVAPLQHVCTDQQEMMFVVQISPPQILLRQWHSCCRSARCEWQGICRCMVKHTRCNLEHSMQKSGMSGMQSMVCHKRQWRSQWSKTGCGPLHCQQQGRMHCVC